MFLIELFCENRKRKPRQIFRSEAHRIILSFLVENNTPVEVIKPWIGHGSERMVRRYTHLRPLYRSRVLASIPSLVGNKIDVIDPLTPFSTEQKVA